MNIKELKTMIASKVQLKEGEFEQVCAEAKKEIEEFGIEFSEDVLVSKVFATYKKQMLSKAKKYKGIILGVSGITDFGAKKQYDLIKEMWAKGDTGIKEGMIKMGYISADGFPLWNKDNTKQAWRYENDGKEKSIEQRKIHLDYEKQKQVVAVMAEYNPDGTLGKYYPANINLRGDNLHKTVPLCQIVEVRLLGKLDEKNNTNVYYLNANESTEFNIVGTKAVGYNDYIQVIKEHFIKKIINLEDINDMKNIPIAKGLTFVINAMPVSIQSTMGDNYKIDLSSTVFGAEDNIFITSWVPQDVDKPVEGMGKIIVCGNASYNDKENRLTINAMSVISSIGTIKPKKVEPQPSINLNDAEEEQEW